MNTHVLPRMACVCAMAAFALTHCGCLSMKGPSGWASAWNSKPKSNSKTNEVVTYWGQKKKEPKPVNKEELKNLMAQGTEESRNSSYDNHMRLGNQALRENRLSDARQEYQRVLSIRPDDPDCHHRLAVVADKEEQFGEADDHYEAALKLRPRDPNLLSDLGYSYMLRKDDRRAEQTLNQALAISPTHKGAMGNLGAIYAKQGRYEDALAMLRRGGPEAEVQRHMAQLFPNRQENPFNALAQNSASPPAARAPHETPDLRGKSMEEVRALMDQERLQSRRERAQRDELENSRAQINWADDASQRQAWQQPGISPNSNQPYVLGPGSNQPSQQSQLPIVTPKSDSFPSNNQGPSPSGQYAANGTANAPGDRQFRAPAGTTPSIEEWSGAGTANRTIDQAAATNESFNRGPVTNAHQQQPSSQFNSIGGTNLQPGLNAPNTRPPEGPSNVNSANLAAAQLGMNVGPGGLFPITADTGTSSPSSFSPPSGFNSNHNSSFNPNNNRQPHEFSAPPAQQNPSSQFQPNRSSFGPADPRQTSATPSQGSFNNGTDSLAPSSPGSNWPQTSNSWSSPTSNWSQPSTNSWSQPASNPPASQAGGTQPNGQTASVPRIGTDPFERFPTPAESGWAEKQNLNAAAPYNGSWPQNPQAPAITNQVSPANVNSLPMWNGGQGDSRPQPKQITAGYPEQWPHNQPR